MKIYVASSWRNAQQQSVVQQLRDAGHEVYDFKNPRPGETGFAWSDIDPDWQAWTPEQFHAALNHPIAKAGYLSDASAMAAADACVMVMPCGRSAHLEAGFFVGSPRKALIILLGEEPAEPELMYKMANAICLSMGEVVERLDAYAESSRMLEDWA